MSLPSYNFSQIQSVIIGIFLVIAVVVIFMTIGRKRRERKFLHDIAHDIRNPLSIIKTNNELAILNPSTPEEIKEILRSNIEELNRTSHIIHKLVK